MSIFLLVLLGVIIVGVMMLAQRYNSLNQLMLDAETEKRAIDVELDRRFKVLESLIEVVKKSMDFEKTTLAEVIGLRNQALKANKSGSVQEQFEAEEKISKAVTQFNMVMESYPELKSNQNLLQMQDQIVHAENMIASARRRYNDTVNVYKAEKTSFFTAFIIGFFPQINKEFAMWELTEASRQEREEHKVKF